MYSCRFQKGHCYLGDKCTFAHGQKECSHWITLYQRQVQHLAQLRREGLLTESFSEMVRRRIKHEGQHHVVSENLFLEWFFHHLSYHYIPPIFFGSFQGIWFPTPSREEGTIRNAWEEPRAGQSRDGAANQISSYNRTADGGHVQDCCMRAMAPSRQNGLSLSTAAVSNFYF